LRTKKLTVYLSGAIEYAPKDGSGWRKRITPRLKGLGYGVYDPVANNDSKLKMLVEEFNALKLNDVEKYKEVVRDRIILSDYEGIINSDILLAFYDESVQKGAGTLSEVALCYLIGIPVLVITKFKTKDIPGWLLAEIHDSFDNVNELLSFISDKSKVKSLINKCKKYAGGDPIVYDIYKFMGRLFKDKSER